MEKVEVFYKPEVEKFINELVFILYKEDYFSFLENAIEYKDKLIDFIENNIQSFPFRFSPLPLYSFGSKYIFYRSNSRTTWYVFFEQKDNKYLITYVTNNHSELSKYL